MQARYCRVFASTCAVFLVAGSVSHAADAVVPEPPYQIHIADYLFAGVVWGDDVRKLLPAGVKPVAELTGGVAVYKSDRGYGISPYDATYLYVDVEGFDAPDGSKGRWMLQGAYGPDEKIANRIRTSYGWPVRAAAVSMWNSGTMSRGRAQVAGKDAVEIELDNANGECVKIGGVSNYVGLVGGKLVLNEIPYDGQWCGLKNGKLNVLAASGDPIAALKPAKVVGFGTFRDAAVTFTKPSPK